MSMPAKILLLLASLWPPLYIAAFFAYVYSAVYPGLAPWGTPDIERTFAGLFALHCLTILGILGLTAYYILHVMKNDRIKGDTKLIWGVSLFMANILVMPVYWYLYIWREPDEGTEAGEVAS